MCVWGSGGKVTASEEVKRGAAETSLFDVDKFCLFRTTGGCKAKNNRAIYRMEPCQFLTLLCHSCKARDAFGGADVHMPMCHFFCFS